MLVLAIADKALDIVGLCTVVYFVSKGTWWLATRKHRAKGQQKPRDFRLD